MIELWKIKRLAEKCITDEGLEFYITYREDPRVLESNKPEIWNQFKRDYEPRFGSIDGIIHHEPRLRIGRMDYYQFWIARYVIINGVKNK